MSDERSVTDMVAELEAQIEHYRGAEARHGEQEVFHREQKAYCAAELAKILVRYEAFKAAATEAGELMGRVPEVARPSRSAQEAQPEDFAGPVQQSRFIARVVEEREPGEAFGATLITQEVHRRFGHRFKRPIDKRLVAVNLRRLCEHGRLRRLHDGTAYHESLYTRGEGRQDRKS